MSKDSDLKPGGPVGAFLQRNFCSEIRIAQIKILILNLMSQPIIPRNKSLVPLCKTFNNKAAVAQIT